MMEEIAYFLTSVFPVHMFFSVQILLAELMFVFSAKKRERPAIRIPVCIVLYLLIAFFHPLCGDKFIRVLLIYGWSLLFVFVVVKAPFKCALFISIASYAIQNLAFNIGSLAILLFRVETNGFFYYLISAICFVIVYTVCYFIFVRRFRHEEELLIKNTALLVLSIVTIAVVYSKNCLLTWGVMNHEELLSLFTSVSCILTLILQFGLLRQEEMAYQNQTIEQLLKSEKERFETLKETIDIVNMKCHDLRFNIREYKAKEVNDDHKKFFDELEESITIYDSISRTGNSAIDTLLSEKLLYCSKNDIQVSYVIDGEALKDVELSDLYSLFGNALDNAVHAVMNEEKDKRIISIDIKRKGSFSHIMVRNSCSAKPQMENGLPVSQKDKRFHGYGMRSMLYIVEKYNGSLAVKYEEGLFNLGILLQPSDKRQ